MHTMPAVRMEPCLTTTDATTAMTVAVTRADDTRRQDVYTTMSYILKVGEIHEVRRHKGMQGDGAAPPRDGGD
jgi:hypothetical protein